MDDYQWMPPGLDPERAQAFLTPSTGLPEAASEAIHRWIVDDKYSHESLSWKFMIDFQSASHMDLGLLHQNTVQVGDALKYLRTLTEDQRTYLLDYMLSGLYPRPDIGRAMPERATRLASILRASGAGWTVMARRGRWGLQRVVPVGVTDVVESVLSSADRASALLRTAWSGAFGLESSPSHAYYDAVRAVEVYSCPLISPRDKLGTLGKDINVLRSKPEAWTFALVGSDRTSAVEHLVSAMQLLWHSQTDRHGYADYRDISQLEAQAAVLLASTIVGWLSQGALRRAT
ncbi:hypothetical protein [Sanguibacter suaedae]|uniref:Uncharacterized protein n=1 Tax=Sanguibacter suaedae TaxID=2795737 RepID=A0A934I3C9_9MICO|nr:hypothetical protein [Sanguibacter suaedae]MBI9114483.1 hypothetical protein [Sanguibacter suaedae]